jgi:hypothetical protein
MDKAMISESDRFNATSVIDPKLERVARAICAACRENPEHAGDARGNAFRWQDYLHVAAAAIAAIDQDGALMWLSNTPISD